MENTFVDLDDYKSVVTPELKVTGTEDKAGFLKDFLENKALRESTKLIGTHSEAFHCDEVLATSMLLRTKEFANSIIVRTRDQTIIEQLDIVADVGGTFDHEKHRYDHHQKTFTHTWYTDKVDEMTAQDSHNPEELKELKAKEITKLSSAGLVYKYFGKEVLESIASDYGKKLTPEQLDKLYGSIYKNFILEIDAIDNVVDPSDDYRYSISTHLSARVANYNSPWNAPEGAYSQHD